MFERLTDRARKVMALANQEAQRFNHEYIGTEHILLGLVKEGSGVGANVLKNLGIDLRKVRLEVEKTKRRQYSPKFKTDAERLDPQLVMAALRRAASAIASLSRAIEAGDMPSDSDGQGEGAGKSGNAKPVSKQLRIAELLPRARKRYEFAAKKSVKTRPAFSPS